MSGEEKMSLADELDAPSPAKGGHTRAVDQVLNVIAEAGDTKLLDATKRAIRDSRPGGVGYRVSQQRLATLLTEAGYPISDGAIQKYRARRWWNDRPDWEDSE